MKKEIVSIFIFISIIGSGLATSHSLAYHDQLYIVFDFSWLDNGDEKAIILVDIPPAGGKAIRYILYEVENNGVSDDFFLYEYGFNHQPTEVYLEYFDFIIVINSDSSGNGIVDEFDFRIRITDDGKTKYSAYSSFGQSVENDYNVAIWQIQDNGGTMNFNFVDQNGDGIPIAFWKRVWTRGYVDPGCNYYNDEQWEDIWFYLDQYFCSTNCIVNQVWIEYMLDNFDFPVPYGATQ